MPSDEPGTRRYEDLYAVGASFIGQRHYRFRGGCVTYHFTFPESGRTGLVNDVTLGLGFRSRADIAAQVSAKSDGRFQGP